MSELTEKEIEAAIPKISEYVFDKFSGGHAITQYKQLIALLHGGEEPFMVFPSYLHIDDRIKAAQKLLNGLIADRDEMLATGWLTEKESDVED